MLFAEWAEHPTGDRDGGRLDVACGDLGAEVEEDAGGGLAHA
jgi:hypothetical protein